jgi:hypothetical protein
MSYEYICFGEVDPNKYIWQWGHTPMQIIFGISRTDVKILRRYECFKKPMSMNIDRCEKTRYTAPDGIFNSKGIFMSPRHIISMLKFQ